MAEVLRRSMGVGQICIALAFAITTLATAEADELCQAPSLALSCLPSSCRCGACGDGGQPHCKRRRRSCVDASHERPRSLTITMPRPCATPIVATLTTPWRRQ
ncbi:hypothetical protein EDB85DRAFT_479492 [Lactarius pseudohatsudake]|nr:hypothetical protein EDB85DRAFT_479492 [Lactarius pseudohatsudake]